MTASVVRPDRANPHGVFSRSIPPVLTIASGDTVTFGTLDADWRIGALPEDGSEGRRFEPRGPVRDAGHALTGPIATAAVGEGFRDAFDLRGRRR